MTSKLRDNKSTCMLIYRKKTVPVLELTPSTGSEMVIARAITLNGIEFRWQVFIHNLYYTLNLSDNVIKLC